MNRSAGEVNAPSVFLTCTGGTKVGHTVVYDQDRVETNVYRMFAAVCPDERTLCRFQRMFDEISEISEDHEIRSVWFGRGLHRSFAVFYARVEEADVASLRKVLLRAAARMWSGERPRVFAAGRFASLYPRLWENVQSEFSRL
jgi:hypothetical protein